MKVTRAQILIRGLSHCCPNCGGRTLFRPGAYFRMNELCPTCGFKFEGTSDDAFFLRSTSLNFGLTVTGFLFPVLLLAYFKRIEVQTAEVLAITGSVGVPIILYRTSRSWGLMNYYIFFPEELPANQGLDSAREKL